MSAVGFLVTIYDEEDAAEGKRFEVTDHAELVALDDIDVDLAAFELGFRPTPAAIYFLGFEQSPFDTILDLLSPQEGLLFMVACLEHVWPLVEQYLPDAVDAAETALELATAIVERPETITFDDFFPAEEPEGWSELKEHFDSVIYYPKVEGAVFGRGLHQQQRKRRAGYRYPQSVNTRSALAMAFGKLLQQVQVLYKIYYHGKGWTKMKAVLFLKKGYQVSEECRKAVSDAAGDADADAEEDWQVLEVFRLALRGESQREFAYKVPYATLDDDYYYVQVVGLLEAT